MLRLQSLSLKVNMKNLPKVLIYMFQGFFDTLRIECYPLNISVTMVCPGPVFSDALLHAFTEIPDHVCQKQKKKKIDNFHKLLDIITVCAESFFIINIDLGTFACLAD